MIDALQANDRLGLATPSDWTPGDKLVFPPGTSDASATKQYGRNWLKLSDYLKAVSYTHLDVYKRQVLRFSAVIWLKTADCPPPVVVPICTCLLYTSRCV